MSVVKVIELLADSEKSWEDAAQQAVMEAAKTVKNIKAVYAENLQAVVTDNKITAYRANVKISFIVQE